MPPTIEPHLRSSKVRNGVLQKSEPLLGLIFAAYWRLSGCDLHTSGICSGLAQA